MKNYITYITAAFFASVMLVACDPKSPETSDSDFLASEHPMTPWVNGIDKEMALAIGTYAELLDVATDNYRNVYSRSNREFDKPNIRYTDSDVENLQRYFLLHFISKAHKEITHFFFLMLFRYELTPT